MSCSFAANDLEMETLAAISGVIGPQETRELLQSLVDSLETALADLRLTRGAENFPALARTAHRLAGGCGSLGAAQMQGALRDLEKAALAPSGALCDAVLARLPQLADRLRSAANHYAAAETVPG